MHFLWFWGGLLEEGFDSLTLGWLAYHDVVNFPPAETTQVPPQHCKDLTWELSWAWKVRPQASQQGTVSWNIDIPYLREGLSNGLVVFWIQWCYRQFFALISTFEDVAEDHEWTNLIGMIRSQRQGQDAYFSVAAEVALVTCDRWSRDISPLIGGVQVMC